MRVSPSKSNSGTDGAPLLPVLTQGEIARMWKSPVGAFANFGSVLRLPLPAKPPWMSENITVGLPEICALLEAVLSQTMQLAMVVVAEAATPPAEPPDGAPLRAIVSLVIVGDALEQ